MPRKVVAMHDRFLALNDISSGSGEADGITLDGPRSRKGSSTLDDHDTSQLDVTAASTTSTPALGSSNDEKADPA